MCYSRTELLPNLACRFIAFSARTWAKPQGYFWFSLTFKNVLLTYSSSKLLPRAPFDFNSRKLILDAVKLQFIPKTEISRPLSRATASNRSDVYQEYKWPMSGEPSQIMLLFSPPPPPPQSSVSDFSDEFHFFLLTYNLTAICQPTVEKMWEPWRLATTWASTACFRDSVAFSCNLKMVQSFEGIMCIQLHGNTRLNPNTWCLYLKL
jgi:hypothetical protein